MNDTGEIGDFEIARGGPFYELQQRIGLLRENAFRAAPRAVLFVALAWGMPFLIAVIQGGAFGKFDAHPFVLSLDSWSRFFVAVGLFVLMERQVEDHLRMNLGQFVHAPVLAPGALAPAARSVNRALKWRDSRLAEFVCLLLAVLGSVITFFNMLDSDASSWAVQVTGDMATLTLAGWWVVVVSNVIFGFLLLRWLWRHALWALLLRDLSRLELRLVANHPDGYGGLGFVGHYPNVYSTYVLAVSFVVGAAIARQMLESGLDAVTYGYIMTSWLAIILALFAIPLLAFRKPLSQLKVQTILACGAQATRHYRAAERELLGRNTTAPADAETQTADEIPDTSKLFTAAQKLKTLPFRRDALLPVSAAALIPLVAAGATQLPFKEIIAIFKRLLLL